MRRLLIVAALVLVIFVAYRGPGAAQTATGTLTLAQPWPTPGEKAPRFEASRQDGEKFKLNGSGTYVVSFWNRLHQGSQSSHPAFERLARDYDGSGVSFAAVYVGEVPQEDHREEANYSVIEDSSGKLASSYNVKRVPRIFLVDDGKVVLAQDDFDERGMRRSLDYTLRDESR